MLGCSGRFVRMNVCPPGSNYIKFAPKGKFCFGWIQEIKGLVCNLTDSLCKGLL
jgi:hypothetical protein